MKHFLRAFLFIIFFLVAKYSKAQFIDNIQAFGGIYSDNIKKILHDKDENTYIFGSIGMPGSIIWSTYIDETIDFGGIKKDIANGFIAKLNKENKFQWVRPAPRSMSNTYIDFTVDPNGNVYVIGALPFSYFFIHKLDINGNLVWEKKLEGKSFKQFNSGLRIRRSFSGSAITIDKKGNIYVAGQFDGADIDNLTFDFNSTTEIEYTDYLAKFNSDGEALWVKTSQGNNLRYTNLTVDSDDNIIAVVGLRDKITIDNETFKNTNPPDNYGVVESRMLIKRDQDGNVIWAKNYPLTVRGFSEIVLDSDDNIYITTHNSNGY